MNNYIVRYFPEQPNESIKVFNLANEYKEDMISMLVYMDALKQKEVGSLVEQHGYWMQQIVAESAFEAIDIFKKNYEER